MGKLPDGYYWLVKEGTIPEPAQVQDGHIIFFSEEHLYTFQWLEQYEYKLHPIAPYVPEVQNG